MAAKTDEQGDFAWSFVVVSSFVILKRPGCYNSNKDWDNSMNVNHVMKTL